MRVEHRLIGAQPIDHGQHPGGVAGRQGEHTDAIQAAAGGQHAMGGHAAGRGLEAHQVVEARRHPTRSSRVRAQGERHLTAGHHHGRAGAGSSTDVRLAEDAARHPVRRSHAHQAGGELVEVGLAHQDGPGALQALHHLGGVGGGVGKARACRRGDPARHIDVVLHRKRDAEQRQGVGRLPLQGLQLGLQLGLGGAGQPGGIVGGQGLPFALQAGQHLGRCHAGPVGRAQAFQGARQRGVVQRRRRRRVRHGVGAGRACSNKALGAVQPTMAPCARIMASVAALNSGK